MTFFNNKNLIETLIEGIKPVVTGHFEPESFFLAFLNFLEFQESDARKKVSVFQSNFSSAEKTFDFDRDDEMEPCFLKLKEYYQQIKPLLIEVLGIFSKWASQNEMFQSFWNVYVFFSTEEKLKQRKNWYHTADKMFAYLHL